MVSLHDIREHVASLFIMLNKKTVILFRIEFLVVLVTLLFFAMFLMDFYRRIIHNSFMRAVFSVFDGVSDSIVVYLLGAMQTAPFKNQLFPVWALVLVNFRYSADYISGYGVPDRRGRRFTEWRNVFKLLGSAFLNWTRGSSFTGPLWLVWGLQIVRSAYRFRSHRLASQEVWHGGSSELVAEHMRAMHEDGDQVSSSCNGELLSPVTMEPYKYLVYGETKQKKGDFKLNKPQYALSLPTDPRRKSKSTRQATTWWCQQKKIPPPLITLDKFWDKQVHQGNNKADQQQPQDQQQGNNKAVKKDLPLAFALYRLLRCRFEDVTLQRCIFDTNRELVKSIVGGKVGVSDALRIMELQLGFVHDYFNTRYPMVFWCGLPSLFFSLLLSVLTMGAVVWLGVGIRKVYKPPSGELANLVKGFNVDTIITWLFIVLMIVKEMWEIFTYLRSDWTRLIMASEYMQRVQHKLSERRQQSADTWKDCVLLYFSRSSKITDRRWHGFIDQYVFVESYDDKPRFWNLIHNLTTGIVPKKDDGAKLSSAVQVPECVRKAVLEKLSKLTEDSGVGQAGGPGRGVGQAGRPGRGVGQAGRPGLLPRFIKTLSNTNLSKELQRYQAYSSATTGGDGVLLPTASHIILVWHIATSLCEMELATMHGVDLGGPRFPCSLLSWFSSLCSSSKPYLMDVDDKKGGCCSSSSLSSWFTFTNCCCSSSKSSDVKTEEKTQVKGKLPAGNLRRTYIIANSLSRYCAYLLVSKPDLIPDSFLVPKIVFQKAVRSARDGIFKGKGSLQERHKALKALMDEGHVRSQGQDKSGGCKAMCGCIFAHMDEAGKAQSTQELKDVGAKRDEEDVLKQGVALGKELLRHPTEEGRWEILADVWTELLIHIAPTWNAQAHRKCLSAGEFITHVWALLWHYGIQKSSLWPKDTRPENIEPQPHVGNGGSDPAAAGIERSQTGGDNIVETGHRITIGEADDNNEKEKGTKEPEAGDSSTTGSSEIEVYGDATTNVPRGMAGQDQNMWQ